MKFRWSLVPLMVSLALTACQHNKADTYEEVRPVRSMVVGQQAGSVGAQYSGEIAARYESRLGFRASGKVVARLVDVGNEVRRGQVLMRLDPEQEALKLSAATADVEAAKSRVAQARIDVQRSQQLLARQFVSRAELDQHQLVLDQAEAQLRAAAALRHIHLNQQSYTTLTADRDGVVTAVHAEAGQVVGAGQPVVTIAANGEREVAISIPESRVDELRRARALKVSIWAHPGKHWDGVLRELAPGADSVTRTYAARIAIAKPDTGLMRLGMTATVSAPDVDGHQAIRLPLTAIVDRESGRQVWVVNTKTSRVEARSVKLGSAEKNSVLVTAGLSSGETVVTAGVHMLKPGQRVKLVNTVAALAGSGK